jgi:uncharacterized protein
VRVLSVVARLPRAALIAGVRGYRLLLSPWLGQGCRFTPTCSVYAIEALERHGAAAGSALAAWRILRCNPLCDGGCDPVPDNAPWRRAARVARARPHSAAGLFTGLKPRDPGASPAAPAADGPAPLLSKTPS